MGLLLILGGVAAVLVFFVATRKPADEPDTVYWDDDNDTPVEEHIQSAHFQPGMMYRWEPIEDLLWAYGYTRDEVRAAWNRNYIEIYRDGLHAEFDGSLFATDKQGNQLYACHQFDPNVDTGRTDRWNRQPTDDERRRAVWRS